MWPAEIVITVGHDFRIVPTARVSQPNGNKFLMLIPLITNQTKGKINLSNSARVDVGRLNGDHDELVGLLRDRLSFAMRRAEAEMVSSIEPLVIGLRAIEEYSPNKVPLYDKPAEGVHAQIAEGTRGRFVGRLTGPRHPVAPILLEITK